MESEMGKLTAAYLPFATFTNALDHLHAIGIPHKIDRDIFPSFSGIMQGQVLGALKFLGLMDEAGTPTNDLAMLVDPKSRKAALKDLLKKRYVALVSLDLTKVSPSQFDKALGDYGVTGATHQKAKSFFLKAAQFVELPLTPLLTRKTRVSTGARRKKSENSRITPPAGELQTRSEAPSLAQIMMSKFPDFNPEWSDEVKAKWFEGFEKITNMMENKAR